MNNKNYKVTWLHYVISFIGSCYLYLVGKTSLAREVDDPEFLELRRKKKPIIYAFWHNSQVYLAYAHRGDPANVVVSQSKDGEYIAQVMKYMRLNPIRGSSSRGGNQALREAIDRLKKGEQVGFTPDGPKGPIYSVRGGVVMAAQTTGVPVVPTNATPRRRIVFNSWDRFVLPLPFSRVVLAHGKPFELSKNLPDEVAKLKVQEAVNSVCRVCDEIDQETSSWLSCFLGYSLIWTYKIFAVLLAPVWFPILCLKFGVFRSFRSLKERLGLLDIPAKGANKRFWFHAASVGEWQALKPLLSKLKKMETIEIIVTVSTPEAQTLVRKEEPNLFSSLLPIDMIGVMSGWIKRLSPDAVFVVETEIWPNLILSVAKQRIPLFLVNGRLSSRSTHRWKWVKPMIQNLLTKFSFTYVRTADDAQHFYQLGSSPTRVQIMGNLKYDNLEIVDKDERMKRKEKITSKVDQLVVIGGSTRIPENADLLKILSELQSQNLRLILAPRRLERVNILKTQLTNGSFSWQLWSEIKGKEDWSTDVLVVDTIGELQTLYSAADIAFVGGSMVPKGGQNPLEPASVSLPILFGPHMENFKDEANYLLKHEAAFEVKDFQNLKEKLQLLLNDQDKRESMGKAAAGVVRSQQGVSDRIISDFRVQLGIK